MRAMGWLGAGLVAAGLGATPALGQVPLPGAGGLPGAAGALPGAAGAIPGGVGGIPGAAGAVPGAAVAAPGIFKRFKMGLADCRLKICATPFGALLNNATLPVSGLTGGVIPQFCPGLNPNDLLKPGVEGAAAQAKKDAAEAKARREAVRYLGTLDCRYFPEAEATLVLALRLDRSECVRFEAAMVLGSGCCCTRKTIEALEASVSGTDRDGAPAERSERVRSAAFVALNRCLDCFHEAPPVPEPVADPKVKIKDPNKELERELPPPREKEEVSIPPAPGSQPPAKGPDAAKSTKPDRELIERARKTAAEFINQRIEGVNVPAAPMQTGQRSLFHIIRHASDGTPATPAAAPTPAMTYPAAPSVSERPARPTAVPTSTTPNRAPAQPKSSPNAWKSLPPTAPANFAEPPRASNPVTRTEAPPRLAPSVTSAPAPRPSGPPARFAELPRVSPVMPTSAPLDVPTLSAPIAPPEAPTLPAPTLPAPTLPAPSVPKAPPVSHMLNRTITPEEPAAQPAPPPAPAPQPQILILPPPTTEPRVPTPQIVIIPQEPSSPKAELPVIRMVPEGPPVQATGISGLLEQLKSGTTDENRKAAVSGLATCDWKQEPEVVSGLMRATRWDPSIAVRVECIRCLATMKADPMYVLDHLLQLQNDPDSTIRVEATKALNSLQDRR